MGDGGINQEIAKRNRSFYLAVLQNKPKYSPGDVLWAYPHQYPLTWGTVLTVQFMSSQWLYQLSGIDDLFTEGDLFRTVSELDAAITMLDKPDTVI